MGNMVEMEEMKIKINGLKNYFIFSKIQNYFEKQKKKKRNCHQTITLINNMTRYRERLPQRSFNRTR